MQRRTKAIIISLAALLLIGVGAYGYAVVAYNTKPVETVQTAPVIKPNPPTVSELLTLVNTERAKVGVAPLTLDERLNTSAQMKADDMLANNYFGHYSPVTGKNSHDYIQNTGITCADASENITKNTYVNDSAYAVEAWIKSPPHHAAMINAKYSLTGFGISGEYIVEHFCQQP